MFANKLRSKVQNAYVSLKLRSHTIKVITIHKISCRIYVFSVITAIISTVCEQLGCSQNRDKNV